MSDEQWVKEAMADDSMVVELLVHLHQASPPKRDSPALPLDWSVRQRRSKPTMLQAKKLTTRASPTTPLSWSGATSFSGGGGAVDGFEESSRPPPKSSGRSRSKGTGASETTTTKRSRKKKTLSELKVEEVLLLKERRHLKRELATLCINLKKQRATNESLKRMKLDLQSQPEAEIVKTVASEEVISDQTQQNAAACDPVHLTSPPIIKDDNLDALPKPSPLSSCLQEQKEVTHQEAKTVVPDLNLPFEEDSSFEVLYGMS